MKYCLNCKHHRKWNYFVSPTTRHLCFLTKKAGQSALGKYYTYDYCGNKNKNNNCKNYNRKWWKFWVVI